MYGAVFAIVRCLSVTFVYCMQKARDIVELLSGPGSPINLFFKYKRRCQIPPLAGRKIHGNGKICDFRLKSPFILQKRYEIGPWLLWNVNRKSQSADRSVSLPMTLSDLERRDARNQIFKRISIITPVSFDIERQSSAG